MLELQVLLEFATLVTVEILGIFPVDQLSDARPSFFGGPEGRDAGGIGACDQLDDLLVGEGWGHGCIVVRGGACGVRRCSISRLWVWRLRGSFSCQDRRHDLAHELLDPADAGRFQEPGDVEAGLGQVIFECFEEQVESVAVAEPQQVRQGFLLGETFSWAVKLIS